MIILDTNVLSALMRQTPDEVIVTWLDRQPRSSIWTTSITVLEVCFGVQIMTAGQRRSAVVEAFESVLDKLGQRVLSFDASAAEQAGDLMASQHKQGRPRDLRDTMIAAIALAQHATLATRNTVHFDDISVPLINPWTTS